MATRIGDTASLSLAIFSEIVGDEIHGAVGDRDSTKIHGGNYTEEPTPAATMFVMERRGKAISIFAGLHVSAIRSNAVP